MAKLKLTLVRSVIGRSKKQKATIDALGLRKMNQTVEKDASPQVRGMVKKVQHLLTCLLYTSPSPRDRTRSRMPSSA